MSSNLEYGYADFTLLHPGSCLVEPVRPSGFSDSGLYVIDQENTFAYKTSMFVRVIGLGPKCRQVKLGGVYVVPVYAWEEMPVKGETWLVMDERNAQAEIENFDEEGYVECDSE